MEANGPLGWIHRRTIAGWNLGDGLAGPGWKVSGLLQLVPSGSLLSVVNGTTSVRSFQDNGDGTFTASNWFQDTLVADTVNHLLILTDPLGSQWQFYDFSGTWTAARRGRLKQASDAAGNLTTTIYGTSGVTQDKILEIDQVDLDPSKNIRILYVYNLSGLTAGQLSNVIYQRVASGTPTTLRQADYTYYPSGGPNGPAGSLQWSKITDGNASNVIDVYYHRYDATGNTPLRLFLDSMGYSRAKAALGGESQIDLASDATLAPWASYTFVNGTFNGIGSVTSETVQGMGCSCGTGAGAGTFNFTYTNSAFSPGVNVWSQKTVETLTDGNQNIIYTDSSGAAILEIFKDTATGQQWMTYHQYDAQRREVLTAFPSAVLGYDEAQPGLVTGANLSPSTGLFQLHGFYSVTNIGLGQVAGYRSTFSVRQGTTGSVIPVLLTKYTSHTDGAGKTIFPVASVTQYRNTDGTGDLTVSFSYTWQGSTNQILERTTTYPAVLVGQNGSGSPTSRRERYDALGRLTWTMDEDGFIRNTTYETLTGGVTQQIVDVNTSLVTPPPGWTTPAGGGLHLVTNHVLDNLGRATQTTDPGGLVSYVVYKDVAHESRLYPGWNAGTGRPTGPTSVSRFDRPGSYSEKLSMTAAPALTSGVPNGTEAISQVQTLSRSYYDNGDRRAYTDAYFDLTAGGFAYSPSPNIGTQGVNFYRTPMSYDGKGLHNRGVSPDGTIQRTVTDSRGRIVSTWVGTNDTPASGDWSPTNNTAPSNMIQQTAFEYDTGGVGDGNLTRSRRLTSPSTFIDTVYQYDFRTRRTAVRGPDKIATRTTYDNLNRSLMSQTFADANQDFVVDAGELRRQSTASHDERGQLYQSSTFNVDPVTGVVGNAQTTKSWFNGRRMMVKSRNPNGIFRKNRYDGAGRVVASYTSFDDAETLYADALTVVGDTVIEQNVPLFDVDGNILATTRYQRTSSAVLTGDLAAAWSVSDSRRTFTAAWFDLGNRLTTTADYGNNGDLPFTRPPTPPAPNSSPDVLVTLIEYDGAGRSYRSTNNLGKASQTTFDALGRPVREVGNFTDGTAGETELDTDRITDIVYDSSGRVTQRIAYNPKGAGAGVTSQITRYVYGTIATSAAPAVFRNDVLTAILYPDSDDTYNPLGAPGAQLGNGADGVYDRVEVAFDYAGRQSTVKDQRGVVRTMNYDAEGRLKSEAATTLPSGVDATVQRIEYTFDDLSRAKTVSSYDAVSGGAVRNQIEYAFDGWGHTISYKQSHVGATGVGTPAMQMTYAEGASGGEAKFARPVSQTYPNGRIVEFTYGAGLDDKLSRVSQIRHGGGSPIFAQYGYLGVASVVKVDHTQVTGNLVFNYGAGTGSPAGWDRFGRPIDLKWGTDADPNLFERRQYTYNTMSERLTSDLTYTGAPANRDEQYTYDNLRRLSTMRRGTLSGGTISNTASTLIQEWTALDAQGNWRTWRTSPGGKASPAFTTQTRAHNSANEIDVDNNDANAAGAAITGSGANWIDPTHDKAGNFKKAPRPGAETTSSQALFFTYDAWNRLTVVKTGNSGATTVAEYQYDGAHQRIVKLIPNGANWNRTDYYLDGKWQVLEERTVTAVVGKTTVATVPKFQWVWDLRHQDAPILRDENKDGDGDCVDGTDQRLYYANDANFNTVALIAVNGTVAERYAYTPYGQVSIFTATWTAQAATVNNNEVLFAGYKQNPETGLYYVRRRNYHPTLGRFLERDPLGYHDSMNLYAYVTGSPYMKLDPTGEAEQSPGYLYLGIPPVKRKPCKKEDKGLGAIPNFRRAARPAPGPGGPVGPGGAGGGGGQEPDKIKPVRVNLMWGDGTDRGSSDRLMGGIVQGLNNILKDFTDDSWIRNTTDPKTRFCVEFKPGMDYGIGDDIPANFWPGDWQAGGGAVPGTYVYSDEGIRLTQEYGTSKTENEILFIIVKSNKNGRALGTTITSNLVTVNQAQVGDKELIFLHEPAALAFIGKSHHLYSHEVAHLSGVPDDPDSTDLNGYQDDDSKHLSPGHEHMLAEYFSAKTAGAQ